MLQRVALCSVVLLAGCAIHPLPENVTALDTNGIVLHVRCEARSAIRDATIAFLLNPHIPIPDGTRDKARALQRGDIRFEHFDVRRLDDFSSHFLVKYAHSAIAYDFTFDIAETNIANASADFGRTISRGVFGLDAGVGSDRQRQTIRNFRVSDTFGRLQHETVCNDPNPPNYLYPITGSVGLHEVVKTFVDLNEFNNLSPGKDSKVPVMADTFRFQTLLGGSVTPSVTLAPLRSTLSLVSASATLSASRRDTHQLVVAMSLPVTDAQIRRERGVGIFSLSPTNATLGRTGAERRALIEIDNQKTINSLNNIVVAPR